MTTPEQHLDNVTDEIMEQLNVLYMSYDTKVLATAMFMTSSFALRGLHSAKVLTVEDVQAIVTKCMHDIYVPLPASKTPHVEMLPNLFNTRLN